MIERTLKILEYDKIVEQLESFAASSLGKELIRELKPLPELEEIKEAQATTTEAVRVLVETERIPLGGIFDVRNPVKKAALGSYLNPGELLEIGSTLRALRLLKEFFEKRSDLPILGDWGSRLRAYPGLERELERCLGPNGEILNSASAKLHSIRSQITVQQNRIRDKLDSIIHSSENAKYLQELLVTVRRDRYVIPVKQEYRSLFPGIVHDQSASGATLFIEPMAVVELNNQLRILESQETEEINAILARLSGRIQEISSEFLVSLNIAARLDFCSAKGRLSLAMNGHEPELNTDGVIELINARHPLLTGKVVPITLSLGKKYDTLVITGPNTGGKTVTLKTVGLLTLMAQSGLHIPAAAGSVTAVFSKIYCDIGDEQSIEQSLSTFSSHLTQIVKIIAAASGPDCLALLDELGAGTDPTEGAALAMSILSHLHRLQVRTVATTHYSELKAFAYQTPGIENASVEFDLETLKPTYHLITGLPGSSQAFQIALKLGLPEHLITDAKGYISAEVAKVEEMLAQIEHDRKKAREDRNISATERIQGERFRNEYEAALTKFNREKAEMLRQARAEAREVLLEARRESENLLRKLKEAPQEQLSGIVNEARRRITDDLAKLDEVTRPERPEKMKPVDPNLLKPGDRIRVRSLDQIGSILELNQDNALVQLGILKVNLPYHDFEPVAAAPGAGEKSKTPKKSTHRGQAVGLETAQNISAEISLRGMTVDEALYELEKYLDQAMLAGLHRFRVIHGKGTGALRQAVQQYLKGNPVVKSVFLAEQNEGGLGASVVELKQ